MSVTLRCKGKHKKVMNDYAYLGPVLTSLILFVNARELREVSREQ